MNIDSIKPTAAVALADIARTLEMGGQPIIKLQTGDPDFATHPSIIKAANKAMLEGHTHYSFSQGLPLLRDIIAANISKEISTTLKRENVVVTNGAVQLISAVMGALIEPQDEVIIFEPNWPTVDSLVMLMGGKPVKIDSFSSKSILQLLEEAYTDKTKMMYFNTPNNPTGIVLPQAVIDSICDWAIAKKIYIVADEVYRYLQFGEVTSSSASYLSKYHKYIFVDSFSKKFAMTGWRIGYAIGEEQTVKRIAKASQLTMTNVAPFVQYGAIEAMQNEESLLYADKMKAEYKTRSTIIQQTCDQLGLNYIKPEGAFYLFIKLTEGIDDVSFCNELLYEHSVCLVPGSAFGTSGKGYVRISYANTIDTVVKGINIINTALKQKK
jgi:aspartate aminotransferase